MSSDGVQNVLRYAACAIGVASVPVGIGLSLAAIGCILLMLEQA